jgi:hypothetical protein
MPVSIEPFLDRAVALSAAEIFDWLARPDGSHEVYVA